MEVVYTQYITALSSNDLRDDGRPVLFAEGLFGDQDSLTAAAAALPENLHNAVECWTLQLPDDGQESHTIRYLPPDDSKKYKVYLLQDGAWKAVSTDTMGSYTLFEAPGTEVQVAIAEQGVSPWVFVAGGTAVVVLLGVAFGIRKKRRRRKAAGPDGNDQTPQATGMTGSE